VHPLITLALLGLVGWGVWQALQPRSIFEVRIERGSPRVVRGTVTRAFLRRIGEACLDHGVARGAVRGRLRGSQITLDFKGPFPPACCQQLRNYWVIAGWSSGPTKGRRGGGRGLA
jgi:hypothetical protein